MIHDVMDHVLFFGNFFVLESLIRSTYYKSLSKSSLFTDLDHIANNYGSGSGTMRAYRKTEPTSFTFFMTFFDFL